MHEILNKLLFVPLTIILTVMMMPLNAIALNGVCVNAPGIPCSGGSSGSSGGGGGPGYWVDPNYRAMIAEQRRLEAEERARKAEAKRKYNTPYRGFEKLRTKTRRNIKETLNRLDSSRTEVKAATLNTVEGKAAIFVPDSILGNIMLSYPVNPVASETRIASEQLRKVSAVISLMNGAGRSTEDKHFIASQAAAIMTGSRSYMHVTVGAAGNAADKTSAEQATEHLQAIEKGQRAIVVSETRREHVLQQAKAEIRELAIMEQEMENAESPVERKILLENIQKSEARMNSFEKQYFNLDAQEKKTRVEIQKSARELRETIIWKK
jgi:hypothetical protein